MHKARWDRVWSDFDKWFEKKRFPSWSAQKRHLRILIDREIDGAAKAAERRAILESRRVRK